MSGTIGRLDAASLIAGFAAGAGIVCLGGFALLVFVARDYNARCAAQKEEIQTTAISAMRECRQALEASTSELTTCASRLSGSVTVTPKP
jgi:hypothetical protein